MSLSQSVDIDHGAGDMENCCQETEENQEMFHGFTQPAQLDNMLVSTQGVTLSYSQTPLQRLVKRMTRFSVTADLETTERELKTRLVTLKYTTAVRDCVCHCPNQRTLTTETMTMMFYTDNCVNYFCLLFKY